jgi:hypothetical protein
MNIPETDTTIEHRCEALTISEIPPYRCTTSATGARQGREVCPSHARSLHVHWFDDDGGRPPPWLTSWRPAVRAMTVGPAIGTHGTKSLAFP